MLLMYLGLAQARQNYGIPSAPLPLYMQWYIKLVQNIAFIGDVLIYIAKRLVLVVVKL